MHSQGPVRILSCSAWFRKNLLEHVWYIVEDQVVVVVVGHSVGLRGWY